MHTFTGSPADIAILDLSIDILTTLDVQKDMLIDLLANGNQDKKDELENKYSSEFASKRAAYMDVVYAKYGDVPTDIFRK